MYGIENLKEATLIAISIGEGFKTRLADGKIVWTEWISFIPTLWSIKEVVMNAGDIWNEIKDLDDVESAELKLFVAEHVELDNDKVEKIIEKSFAWLIATAVLILSFTDDGAIEAL